MERCSSSGGQQQIETRNMSLTPMSPTSPLVNEKEHNEISKITCPELCKTLYWRNTLNSNDKNYQISLIMRPSFTQMTLNYQNYQIIYPTPRNALSVGSFVGSSVRPSVCRKVPHLTRTISRQRKELPEICWCQNDWIF